MAFPPLGGACHSGIGIPLRGCGLGPPFAGSTFLLALATFLAVALTLVRTIRLAVVGMITALSSVRNSADCCLNAGSVPLHSCVGLETKSWNPRTLRTTLLLAIYAW